MVDSCLNELKIEELQIVLEHLKLGPDHLKKQLTSSQFKELENYGSVATHEKKMFAVDKTEKISHISMILNSVITGIVGAWMGIATALNIEISSKLPLVGVLSIICGAGMVITIFFRKKKESEEIVSSLKLINFESQIFESIYMKQKEKLDNLIEKLKKKYEEIAHKKIEKQPPSFEKKEDFSSWFYLFHHAIHLKLSEFPKEEIFIYYRDKLLEILKVTENSFIEKGQLVGNFGSSLKQIHVLSKKSHTSSALDILVDPSRSIPKVSIHKVPWYKKKIFRILFDLFPFILGVVGSILMWCNSIPLLSSIFVDIDGFDELLKHPYVSYVKIFITFAFTFNFIFFYYYAQKKMFERQSIIKLKKRKLLNQEATTVQMGQRLNLVYFLDERIEEMVKFLTYSDIFKRFFKKENTDSFEVAQDLIKQN